MGVTMHAKSDSDATSIDAAASPPRPLYFVQSPSHHDYSADKLSYANSSPFASPPHHLYNPGHYHSSPVHHSRESSTSRFSAALFVKSGSRSANAWRRLYSRSGEKEAELEDENDEVAEEEKELRRFYVICFLVSFVALFTVFSLILWAVATTFPPKIYVQGIRFRSLNIQGSTDRTGVPTPLLSLNSTVQIFYRNPASFFGVHVSSTPLKLKYYDFEVAYGNMTKFYQPRKSEKWVVESISAKNKPTYGALPFISGDKISLENIKIPLNLTFVMKSQAYVLGRLVKPTFYRKIRCKVTLKAKELDKHQKLADQCFYDE